METITIDRNFWYRGNGDADSRLLVPSSLERCCVGFMCQHRGIDDDDLYDTSTISSLSNRKNIADWLENPTGEHAGFDLVEKSWIKQAYSINDDAMIDDVERESKLKMLAKQNGVILIFIN